VSNELYNNEAEQYLLAAMLRYPEAYWTINEVGLSALDFVNVENRKVAKAIFRIVADKAEPTLPFVIEQLRVQGDNDVLDYVSTMTTVPVSVAQAADYARIVKALSVNRNIGYFGAKVIAISQEKRTDYESSLTEVETGLRRLVTTLPDQAESAHVGDILERYRNRKVSDAIPISFSKTLQAMTGGLHRTHFWVIGGFSSTGKSAFAVNMALDAMLKRKKVVVVSAEMSQEQYLIRMLATLSGVSQLDIQNNVTIGIENMQRLKDAEADLAKAELYVYSNLYTMPQIRTELTRRKNRDGIDLFILDYIQNVSITGDEVSDAREVALECQRLAKDLDCATIAMSQLSNAQAKYEMEGGDENYYSLKGHGAIRDAADVICTLHRDRVQKSSTLKVKMRKHRHGPMSDFECYFDLTTGRIEEVEYEYVE
jgi:replicative DNA helicase